MASSLQTGSVAMDIRRYGSKGEIMGECASGFLFIYLLVTFLYQAASCIDILLNATGSSAVFNSAELTTACFSSDWSSSGSGGGLHSLHSQSRMTLNLTSASPVLITRQTDSAAAAAAAGQASGSNGQADHVSGALAGVCTALSVRSQPTGVTLGLLLPGHAR